MNFVLNEPDSFGNLLNETVWYPSRGTQQLIDALQDESLSVETKESAFAVIADRVLQDVHVVQLPNAYYTRYIEAHTNRPEEVAQYYQRNIYRILIRAGRQDLFSLVDAHSPQQSLEIATDANRIRPIHEGIMEALLQKDWTSLRVLRNGQRLRVHFPFCAISAMTNRELEYAVRRVKLYELEFITDLFVLNRPIPRYLKKKYVALASYDELSMTDKQYVLDELYYIRDEIDAAHNNDLLRTMQNVANAIRANQSIHDVMNRAPPLVNNEMRVLANANVIRTLIARSKQRNTNPREMDWLQDALERREVLLYNCNEATPYLSKLLYENDRLEFAHENGCVVRSAPQYIGIYNASLFA